MYTELVEKKNEKRTTNNTHMYSHNKRHSEGTNIILFLSISIHLSIHKYIMIAFCVGEKLISLLNILGKSIDNSLTQNYQPLEYENPSTAPKFISRGQSYRAVIGDTIVLPCATQDLGEKSSHYFYIVFDCFVIVVFCIIIVIIVCYCYAYKRVCIEFKPMGLLTLIDGA